MVSVTLVWRQHSNNPFNFSDLNSQVIIMTIYIIFISLVEHSALPSFRAIDGGFTTIYYKQLLNKHWAVFKVLILNCIVVLHPCSKWIALYGVVGMPLLNHFTFSLLSAKIQSPIGRPSRGLNMAHQIQRKSNGSGRNEHARNFNRNFR